VYVDVWVRGRTRTVQPFQRKLIRPEDSLVEEFPRLVARIADEIVRDAEVANSDVSLATKLSAYPMRGMFRRDSCTWCEFAPLCWDFPDDPERALDGFRPRAPKEATS
jgi:hypothetical protein